MIRPGLVSITFRKRSPQEIVDLVRQAGLQGIEWGGDVHVPHGEIATAEEVKCRTEDAGLIVAAYGSYYRAGASEAEGLAFVSVAETAAMLGAPLIRIWAGKKGSADADRAYREAVAQDTRRAADLARTLGIRIALEYHANTLTDTSESAQRFLAEVAHDNVSTYWQPPAGLPQGECEAGLRAVLPQLANLHVFHWVVGEHGRERRPLAEGRVPWAAYLDLARSTGRDPWALLEFVAGDAAEQFLADAAALREWVEG